MSSETSAPKKLLIKPIIISNKKKMVIKSPKLLANVKFPAKPIVQYKEEVVYASPNCDFLKGESQEVLILNRLHLLSKSCRTIAKCTSKNVTNETTSDSVSALIGQKNYDTVLSALSSVFNEETKVRGILALLSTQKKFSTAATQTESPMAEVKKTLADMSCQTVDSRLNMFVNEKKRKRIRRQPLTPYVVPPQDKPSKLKKFVININNLTNNNAQLDKKEKNINTPSLPDLKSVIDEDSNISSCGSVSNLSLSSLPSVSGILYNANEIMSGIDKVTDKTLNSTGIRLNDGSLIMIPVKPEDDFHILTPDVLKNVTHEEKMKLVWHQAYIDFKMCLQQDNDGYYPLHIAVLNNDLDLVRRQCASLRARHESVDIPAGGLTALHMAVRQNASVSCTSILLQYGADPLQCDQDRRCSLHLAADMDTPQLRCLLAYMDTHARSVLKNNQDFWRPELESKTDEELTKYMYNRVSKMFDDQGYNPLMVAAEAGNPAHVALLASRAGPLVDTPSPTCGATALYRAVVRACLNAKETDYRTTASDNLLKTIELLVEHGADPCIENHSGSSVNTLLTEFNISALSMIIANKMTAMKHGKNACDNVNMMLYKHNDGSIGYINMNSGKNITEVRNIPPNLHAIVTIDVPKTPSKDKKGKGNVKSPKEAGESNDNVKSEFDVRTGKSNEKDASSSENATARIVNSNEMRNLKGDRIFKGKKIKNAIDLRHNELTQMIKQYKVIKDSNTDNVKLEGELGNVVLERVNTISDKNVLGGANTVKVSLKQLKGAKLGKHIALKRMKSDVITNMKHVKLENASTVITDEIISKDRTLNASLNNHIKVGFVLSRNADKNSKGINFINTSFDAVDKKNIQNESKNKSPTKQTGTNSNDEKPTRSGKERKTEKIVIVEDVALKKGFPMPNMLQPGSSNPVHPKDILISSNTVPKNVVSPTIVIETSTAHNVGNIRKRKLRSE